MYAAKIIYLSQQEDDVGENAEVVGTVRNEVALMRKLQHENIIKFVDVFYTDERIVVILELTDVSINFLFSDF